MSRGRKRKVDYSEVVAFVLANPTLIQAEIASHFGITQSRVSDILCRNNIHTPRRGKQVKLRPGQTALEYKWEKFLHDSNLGMDRGLRLGGKRIFYGQDPRKESLDDASATCNAE